MPYINTIANVPIPHEARETIKTRLGELITILGKTEMQLMVDFTENSPLYFQGSSAPAAMVSVDVFGGASTEAYNDFSAGVVKLLGEVIDMPAGRIFLKLDDHPYWTMGSRHV